MTTNRSLKTLVAFLCVLFAFTGSASAAKVVCFGDSITKRGYPKILGQLLGVEAINAGVGGNSSAKALRRMASDVLAQKPDVVVIFFGTNDLRADADHAYVPIAKYKANLETMITRCRQQSASVVLCTLPPIEHKAFFTRHQREPFEALGGLAKLIQTYRRAASEVAAAQKVSLVDLNQLLAQQPEWISNDGVHPSDKGTAIIAKHISKAVAPLIASHATLVKAADNTSTTNVNTKLTVASPFTDNAVLQQKMPVPVWGKASAAAKVTVEFFGQKKTTVADANGNWKVILDPLKASAKPGELSVVSSIGNQKLTLGNVVVGEVWICSGQSNMQMGVNTVPNIKALVPGLKNIRKFTVKQTVSFSEQTTCSGQWMEQHPESAVAFAFASHLQKEADVPVGIIQTCWGSSSIEGWMPRDMTSKLPHFKSVMQTFDADTEKRTKIETILNGKKPWGRKNDIFLRTQPNIIYNAMMHPLAPLACRGIVWYQGEANGNNIPSMLQYGKTLPAWIQRYREHWGRDDLHFLLVMLPGFARGLKDQAANPTAKSWAWMRESQMKALKLPHTSVANTIDLGDANNIHPKDKLPIGKRLALLAAQDVLGMDVESRGPVMKRVEAMGNELVVHFDHAKSLQTRDEKAPTGFWVADDSKKWVKAEAKLVGQTVVLTSSELEKPLYVRYAFAGKPNVNLVNEASLPAYPFRTDTFLP